MNGITLDADTVNKLQQIQDPVELCDLSGRVLGRFVPNLDLSEWEPAAPEVSEEELDRRGKETESFSTLEVLEFLRKLP